MKNKLGRLVDRLRKKPVGSEGEDAFPAADNFDAPPVAEPGELRMAALGPAPKHVRALRKERKTERRERKASAAAKDYEVLTVADAVRTIISRKVLICGHGVFASLDPLAPPPSEAFVSQRSRATMPGLKMLVAGKKAKTLHVSVDGRLFQQAKTRYAFALDGYLRWGFAHADGTTVLLGGGEAPGTTYLDVYVFQDRVLVEMFERELPGSGEREFAVALRTLLDELNRKYGQPRVLAAAPLPEWGRDDIAYIGDAALRGLTFLPLSDKPAVASGTRGAIAVAGLGLLTYAAMLGVGWNLYASAGGAYKAEVDDPALTKAGGIDNARLDVMQQQRLFMDEPRAQGDLAKRAGEVVAGIASIPGVRINRIAFGAAVAGAAAEQGSGPAPDVAMELQVPVEGPSAVKHAEALMTAISARTGAKLRLTAGGWTTDENAGTRILHIEGFTK